MSNAVMIDKRLESKIESMESWGGVCNVKFKDLDDTFWFNSSLELQEFIHQQTVERFYDKQLRKGYFLYINENNDTLKYHVNCTRGNLILLKEECLQPEDKIC